MLLNIYIVLCSYLLAWLTGLLWVAKLHTRLSTEIDRTIDSEFPECKDRTPISIVPVVNCVVAIVFGKIFVGPEYCRHKVYF